MSLTKKIFYAATLVTVVMATSGVAQGTRWLSRYWDGCKPSCSWTEHAGNNLAKNCDQSGKNVHSSPTANACAKDGGSAYTCWDQIPFVSSTDPNLAYGFGATSGAACGTCFEVTFDGGFEHGTAYATHAALKGKKVIIMGRNTGNDVGGNQIDFMVPGGGLGQYDCFTRQLGSPAPNLGQNKGGLLADCETQLSWGNGSLAEYQKCLRDKCDATFNKTGQEVLKQGCRFYADFMMAANNPTGTVRTVACPAELTARYGGTTYNPPGGTTIVDPQPSTYTVTVGRSPTAGGNVRVNNGSNNPNGAQGPFNSGTSVTVTATANTNYTFTNWTAQSGTQLPSGFNANSATNTFNITANVNVQANFTATTVQPTTYNVQVGRSSTSRGNVTIKVGSGAEQQNPSNAVSVAQGTQVVITATPTTGNKFDNWTVVSGTLPSGVSLTNATLTFTPTAAVNLRANFSANNTGDQPAQYTVEVTRSSTTRGSVTVNNTQNPNGEQSFNANTPMTITAAPASAEYKFDNWTVVSGTPPAGTSLTNATLTFTLTGDVSLRANFSRVGTTDPGNGGPRTDTTKVEAENLKASLPTCNSGDNPMCIGTTPDGTITNIGWINGGNSAEYDVSIARAGNYTMVFRVASGVSSNFTVSVNGASVGQISVSGNDWDAYTYVTLDSDVSLTAGNNTVKLDFATAVNVDYFLLLGEPPAAVRYNITRASKVSRARISLTPVSGGFVAGLPVEHKFTSYRLVDLQGREIRRGRIAAGTTDLKIGNVKSGVVFLRLEGAGVKSEVLRATATR